MDLTSSIALAGLGRTGKWEIVIHVIEVWQPLREGPAKRQAADTRRASACFARAGLIFLFGPVWKWE
jgi:hypothetical protein